MNQQLVETTGMTETTRQSVKVKLLSLKFFLYRQPTSPAAPADPEVILSIGGKEWWQEPSELIFTDHQPVIRCNHRDINKAALASRMPDEPWNPALSHYCSVGEEGEDAETPALSTVLSMVPSAHRSLHKHTDLKEPRDCGCSGCLGWRKLIMTTWKLLLLTRTPVLRWFS